ncbi:MAG: hypothetical protein Q9187_007015 [Circinaria calcarea]
MSHLSTAHDDSPALGSELLAAFSHVLNDPLDPTSRRGETLLLLIQDASLSANDRLIASTELGQRAGTALSIASSLKRQYRAAVRVLGAVSLDDLSEHVLQEFQTGWSVYCERVGDLVAMVSPLREQLVMLMGRVRREVDRGTRVVSRGVELTDTAWVEFWETVKDVRECRARVEGVLAEARRRREQARLEDGGTESVEERSSDEESIEEEAVAERIE